MSKVNLLFISIVFITLVSCQSIDKKAAAIHQKVFTIDSHTDTPLKFFNANYDLGIEHDARKGDGRIDLPRMEKGGLDAAFFAVFIGQGKRDSLGHADAFLKAEQIFAATHKAIAPYASKAQIVTSPEQGYAMEKEGKRAIYFGIENAYPIGSDLTRKIHYLVVKMGAKCYI